MDLERLSDPFHSSKIHWRVGATNLDAQGNLKWGGEPKGIPLAYLTSRDVMDRLDRVCGLDGWQTEHYKLGGTTLCRLSINIDGNWISKTDGSGDTKIDPEKGGLSGATKRVAVSWGIGRYLYGLDMGWWPLDNRKNFAKDTMTKLNAAYENWLIDDEGPLKSLVERQEILSNHLGSVQAVKEGIASDSLSVGAEEWFTLPVEVQTALLFSPSRGGIFTTREIAVMRTSEFRQAYYGECMKEEA